MRQFEFHAYRGDEHGVIEERPEVIVQGYDEKAQAVRHAGHLCKSYLGPVDLAFAGPGDWSDRYITTASPSEHHASGYRFERLDS